MSRFVRAVAWSQTTRSLPIGKEATYELFRILDNFNLPVGAADGVMDNVQAEHEGMHSSSIRTSGWDLKNKALYYHAQHNRRLRRVHLTKLDFSGKAIRTFPLDEVKEQDIKDVTSLKSAV